MTLNQPVFYSLLALLALIQTWFLARNRTLTGARKAVRAGLNLLLWLILLGFVWQPAWTSRLDTTHVLLVSDEVPNAVARQVQDSLRIREQVSATTIKPELVDSVTLLGQQFPPALLARLSRQTLRWVPFNEPDKPIGLRWKGIVRVGEEQRIQGAILATKRQKLAVRFGNQVVDSLWLGAGQQAFTLQFPALAKGRTETVLWLGNEPIDTVRFFAQGTRPLNIRFVLNTPDFETKTLADWLGRQGNRVELSSNLSTGIEATLQINTPAKQTAKNSSATPDLIITEPGLVGQSLVRKALAERKSVLVLNITNPPSEALAINRAMGTNWRFRKVSNEETIPAGNDLTALPYQFAPSPNQFDIQGYPVAMQAVGGKVALSLFSETFPLKLSGDSVAYARIWNSILAKLQPVQVNNLVIDAPVLPARRHALLVNNPSVQPTLLRLANDTVSTTPVPLNTQSFTTQYRFTKSGWQSLADSAEVIVEDSLANPDQSVTAWLAAHNQYQTGSFRVVPTREQRIPDWLWLVLILGGLTALWVEPKL